MLFENDLFDPPENEHLCLLHPLIQILVKGKGCIDIIIATRGWSGHCGGDFDCWIQCGGGVPVIKMDTHDFWAKSFE